MSSTHYDPYDPEEQTLRRLSPREQWDFLSGEAACPDVAARYAEAGEREGPGMVDGLSGAFRQAQETLRRAEAKEREALQLTRESFIRLQLARDIRRAGALCLVGAALLGLWVLWVCASTLPR